ncbi:hypothetical protein AcV7_004960 [Taiwanofungus camphoratus]|nr:hypothetical protein AcV7_004960 [Antrodia cinnamomea]
MMSKKNEDKKSIAIVGGGYVGSLLARELSAKLDASKYDLIMINRGVSRIPRLSRTTVFINGNGSVQLGRVTAIEETTPGAGGVVVPQSGERISYTALVLASGSIWPGTLNFFEADSDVRLHINEWQKKFASANNIYLAGGGAVGIETAGEIKDA